MLTIGEKSINILSLATENIVNLLNGAELIPSLLQVCYAIAIGYMLVMVFYKSKSIIPCIVFHMVFNSLSIFSAGYTLLFNKYYIVQRILIFS